MKIKYVPNPIRLDGIKWRDCPRCNGRGIIISTNQDKSLFRRRRCRRCREAVKTHDEFKKANVEHILGSLFHDEQVNFHRLMKDLPKTVRKSIVIKFLNAALVQDNLVAVKIGKEIVLCRPPFPEFPTRLRWRKKDA